MPDHFEVKAENARNVILSYNDMVYYVNGVNVQIQDGVSKLKAIFHAKRATDNTIQDLDIDISQDIYDLLVEYAKLDKMGSIMVLQIDGECTKWCLMSGNWHKSEIQYTRNSSYVV